MFSLRNSTVVLRNVLCVPSIRRNLMSVSVLDEKGHETWFRSDKVFISKENVLVKGVKILTIWTQF